MDDIRTLDTSVSEIGLGSPFSPWEDSPIGRANARAARIFKVARAMITTNGTTGSNFLALYTLLSPGDQVIVERDSHGSVLSSLNVIGAHPVWVNPEYDQTLGANLGATVPAIREAMERAPGARVAVLTSPKYPGIVGDLNAVIAELHGNGVAVMVDAAHGSNFSFHPDLPISAVEAGADLVTMSIHKTTEAPSQGSLVLLNTSDPGIHDAFLDSLNSTPSVSTSIHTGLIALTEEAIVSLAKYGKERISAALDLAEDFRCQVRAMAPPYDTWGVEQAGRPGFAQLDPTRVTVDVASTGLTGIEVERLMQVERIGLPRVVPEMGGLTNVLFLVNWGNSWHDVEVAAAHLQHIALKYNRPLTATVPVPLASLPPQVVPPCEAQWSVKRGRFRIVEGRDAVGQVSAETVAVYPPGWPVIVQGERITGDGFDYLTETVARGAHLKGASNNFKTVKVML